MDELGEPAIAVQELSQREDREGRGETVKTNWEIGGMVVCGAIVVFCIFISGFSIGREWTQHKAIEAGCAHWTIDPQTGVKSFEWGSQGDD